MKKIVVISIIIAAIAAVLAVCAVKTGLFRSAEAEKPAVEQKELKKPVRFIPKKKIDKLQRIDSMKLLDAARKVKEKNDEESGRQDPKNCSEVK